ncbi:FAD dependent oxidoreductase superfamily protein [Penicillium pulvis]|uniref:FAD dependent oxidoreductase superfamily protein n=1 Tax=Penicillium pulvis TaxID=1562058 RepID=UPI0025466EFC|nr:FAD dependent oxidoreductase superfamily protein [Penicillium pulvis]KAJ5784979.1 FAD dependent oxidoreductase superfamily protein [Penicillium pulvis]
MLSKDALVARIKADPLLPRPNPTATFWQEPPHPTVASIQSQELPSKTDIAIIGSGITGCSVAKALLEDPSLAGKTVTILEAREVTSSATGRNGGHLVSDCLESFALVSATLGTDHAVEVARFSLASMQRLRDVVAAFGGDLAEKSKVREVISTSVLGDEESLEEARVSLAAFEEALPDLKGMFVLLGKEEAMEKYKYRDLFGVMEQYGAGALWPYRLITGIFEILLQRYPDRFSIESSTPVTAIAFSAESPEDPYPYRLSTPRGTISATKVIHCTNGHAAHLLPGLSGKLFPFRGTMSTQAAGKEFPNNGSSLSWNYVGKSIIDPETGIWSYTLYYITQDPESGDIFIGGEKQKADEVFVSDDTVLPPIPAENLTTILPTIFREGWNETAPEVKKMWSGIMGFTADGLPLVGNLPENATGRAGEGEWIAAGYSGHGMDKSWLTGESLAGMVSGKGIPAGFPRAYLLTDERLTRLSADVFVENVFGHVSTD